MSKAMLIAAIVASFLAVGLVAVLTATVIVNDSGDGGDRILRVVGPAPDRSPGTPLPGLRGGAAPFDRLPDLRTFDRLPDLRTCLRTYGLGLQGGTTPSDLKTMREAPSACAGLEPHMAPLPTR